MVNKCTKQQKFIPYENDRNQVIEEYVLSFYILILNTSLNMSWFDTICKSSNLSQYIAALFTMNI